MMYKTLVLTGTSAAGKTTVARALAASGHRFALIQAVTTRAARTDDDNGVYEHVNAEEFDRLVETDALLLHTTYRNRRYGLRRSRVQQQLDGGRVPVLVLTPDSAAELIVDDPFEQSDVAPLAVFLDAPDAVLDERLVARGGGVTDEDRRQRETDRAHAQRAVYSIRGGTVEDARNLVAAVWDSQSRNGVLPAALIKRLIRCGTLLENSAVDRVSGASYDLSLGDQYFYGGRIHTLSDKKPILTVAPYDYAIVTSQELADLPRDTCGRFDLAVNLFCQGLILSNGPQVDPGFRGTLFSLLFNTSSSPVMLKRRQHYATIEFHKLIAPTYGYKGRYQAKRLLVSCNSDSWHKSRSAAPGWQGARSAHSGTM